MKKIYTRELRKRIGAEEYDNVEFHSCTARLYMERDNTLRKIQMVLSAIVAAASATVGYAYECDELTARNAWNIEGCILLFSSMMRICTSVERTDYAKNIEHSIQYVTNRIPDGMGLFKERILIELEIPDEDSDEMSGSGKEATVMSSILRECAEKLALLVG